MYVVAATATSVFYPPSEKAKSMSTCKTHTVNIVHTYILLPRRFSFNQVSHIPTYILHIKLEKLLPKYAVHVNTHTRTQRAPFDPIIIYFWTGVFLCIYVNKYFCLS